MHQITEHMAVGDAADAANPPALVTVVLNVASEITIEPPAGKVYHWIPFREYAEADPILLDEAVSWLDRQAPDNRVLVCCRAGMGRSVSVVIAYLCLTNGMTYREAFDLVSHRRPGATPLPELEGTILVVRSLRQNRGRRPDAGVA
jgi:protein-tyrosine phosphatase